jgi:hypothetical protein
MSCTAHTEDLERELDFRANDGVEIALLWRVGEPRLIIEVVDTKVADAFRLEVAAAEAFDAFQHPYAYAAFRGVEYIEPRLEATPVLQ